MVVEGRSTSRARHSAGILLYRRSPRLEVLIGHMGGPFWTRKEARAWSIPKGELRPGEEPWSAALREFEEELGVSPPTGPRLPLGDVRQSGGKTVSVWALEGDVDLDAFTPGTFELEWPPRSGVLRHFPELDRVRWTTLEDAAELLVTAQAAFLPRLDAALRSLE